MLYQSSGDIVKQTDWHFQKTKTKPKAKKKKATNYNFRPMRTYLRSDIVDDHWLLQGTEKWNAIHWCCIKKFQTFENSFNPLIFWAGFYVCMDILSLLHSSIFGLFISIILYGAQIFPCGQLNYYWMFFTLFVWLISILNLCLIS